MHGARYLEDGKLTIFRRSGTYYARIRTSASDKYIVRSPKTSTEATAIQLGRRLLFQIEHRAEQGLPPKSKKFSKVIDDYIRNRERDHAHGKTSDGMLRQIVRVSKFWRAYAGELAVEAIDDKVMREVIPWRRDYYSKFRKLPRNARRHPTDKTLQWDMMLGKPIVKWAHEQGLRGNQALPSVTFTPKKKRVRPAFEIPEYKRLWRTMYRRINNAGDRRISKSRELLRDYVLVLANSGMRVGEANNLRLRDVIPFRDGKERSNFRFIVRGKTGTDDLCGASDQDSEVHHDRHRAYYPITGLVSPRDGCGGTVLHCRTFVFRSEPPSAWTYQCRATAVSRVRHGGFHSWSDVVEFRFGKSQRPRNSLRGHQARDWTAMVR
jgi:hypothetical protein